MRKSQISKTKGKTKDQTEKLEGGGGWRSSVRQGARTQTERKYRSKTKRERKTKGQRKTEQNHKLSIKRKEKPQASPPGSLPWPLGQTELKI